TITSAPAVVPYGSSSFTLDTPDASAITSVALVSLASVTHSTDMNQFYTELQFTAGTGQLTIAAPQDGNQVPPGHYMLFIVNATRVPARPKIARVGSSSPPSPPTPAPPPTTTPPPTSSSTSSPSTSSTSSTSPTPTTAAPTTSTTVTSTTAT